MPAQSGVELVCRLVVESAGRMRTVFDLGNFVDVVADHCMPEDRIDRCSP